MIDDIGAASIPTGKKVLRALPALLRDAIGLAAVGAISYGAWLLHPAAGFITGGALVLTGVIITARKPAGNA